MFFITVVVLSSKLVLRTHSKVVREKKVPAEVIFLQNLSSAPVQPFLTFLDDMLWIIATENNQARNSNVPASNNKDNERK